MKRKLQIGSYTSKLVMWLLAVIVLASCNRRLAGIIDHGNRLTVKDVDFEYLTSKAKIDFESADQNVGATANIRIRKDSIIWMSLTLGPGIEVARFFVSRDTVVLIDKVNKAYSIYTFEQLTKQLSFEINYDMVEAVILGNLMFPYEREHLEKSDDKLVYRQEIGAFQTQNFIGKENLKLEEIHVLDTLSKNTISVNYSDFQLVEEEVFPFLINAQLDYANKETKPIKVAIEYKQNQIENKPLKFPINIPSRYDRR